MKRFAPLLFSTAFFAVALFGAPSIVGSASAESVSNAIFGLVTGRNQTGIVTGESAAISPGSILTVTKTADTNDGVCNSDCSLREAIIAANSLAGADTIRFNIDNAVYGPPPHVITPGSNLPAITQALTIDGLSEPDIVGGNCPIGSPTNDDLAIQIDDPGNLLYGLLVTSSAGGSSVRGLSITRFGGAGAIQMQSSASVTCSYIGVAANGVTAGGNGLGLATASTSNVTIGGPGGDGNVIANSAQQGIYISGGTTNSTIRGNVIRDNGQDGIVSEGGAAIVGVRISENRFYGNGQEALDLNTNGVSPNDTGDSDGGHNNLQNFPVITSANTSPAATAAYFTLDSNPGNYTVEFYSNPSCDGTNGEGRVFLGSTSVTLPGGPFSMPTLPATTVGHVITSIAIKESGTGGTVGDTSEFSACAQIGSNSAPVLSGLAFSPNPATAGEPTALAGTASDANAGDSLSVTVNWGDGSPDTVQNVSNGTPFSINHTYSTSNAYSATVTVSDGLAQDVETAPVTVNPACLPNPVVTNINDTGSGSLRQAVQTACTGGAIGFDSGGVFAQPRTIVLTTGELLINKNLTITGTGANLLTISGNNASRIFQLQGATVAISGLTVTGGNADNGGGIFSFGSQLTIANCVVAGNVTTGNAGGIYNINGTLDLFNSTVSGNSAAVIGGGIANGSGASVVNVTNSTISGNSASGGGGIFTNGAITVRSSTITANSATTEGGGVSNFTFDAVSLGNTIVAGNTAPVAPDFRDTITSLGFNLIGNTNGTLITGDPTGNLLNQDARLMPLGIYGGPTLTHALMPGSPAINAGTATNAPTTDQRGRPRVGQVDIGAYEFPPTLTVTKTADTNDGICDADCSLREAVAAAASGDLILFASPLFDTPQTVQMNGQIVINKTVTIAGRGSTLTTVANIAAQGSTSRVFLVDPTGNLTLTNVTVSGGNLPGNNSGGGILNRNVLTMIGCQISGNSIAGIGNGGGIGAGLIFTSDAPTTLIVNSTISGNQAQVGGGTYLLGGNATIINSTISGNQATSGGGGIFNSTGSVNIINSTLTSNSSSLGGGLSVETGAATLRNSIVGQNSATNGRPDVAAASGGTIASNGNNLIGNAVDTLNPITWQSSDLLNQDPLLAPLGFYGGAIRTHALLSSSPAINAGNNCVSNQSCAASNSPVPLPTDQRGAARVGNVDIGAFELNNSANGGNYRATLPDGTVNVPYSFLLIPNNGTTNYAVTGGTLPNGVNLTTNFAPSAVVALAGTPTNGGTFNFSVTATNGANTNVTDYAIDVLAPTAAGVEIAGRVMTDDGRGLANAIVILTDSQGVSRSIRTSSFGNFRFDNVESGQTVTIEVKARNVVFSPQVVYVGDNIGDLNFIGAGRN